MSRSPLRRLIVLRKFRPLILIGLGALIITQIVILSPAPLEEGATSSASLEPEALLPDETEVTLAPGIPKGKVPAYTIEKFEYVATSGVQKQWKLIADRAALYNENRLVHARQVRAFLYDPDGKITEVTGKEAKYFMNARDLEIFGDVTVNFPDGFKLASQYLRYRPNERRIDIPQSQPVQGVEKESADRAMSFSSLGLAMQMDQSEIVLPKSVRVHYVVAGSSEGPTTIDSDRCVIERPKQLAKFSMDAWRPIKERFVHVSQNKMVVQSRRAELNYGERADLIQYLSVFEDVLVREVGPKPVLRYATGGRALFDAKTDRIVLSEFPQVYQDNDTVTGDVIVLHRDSDIVEVENANAYSQGQ